MQSLFTLARLIGAGKNVAWAIHGAFVACGVLALCAIWRSRVSFDMKAAALGTGVLLATPYLFLYDMVALAVPLAFLVREGERIGFLPFEWPAIGAACLLILVYPVFTAPVGLVAALIVAALVGRRIVLQGRPATAAVGAVS